jgi:hypothetical protein
MKKPSTKMVRRMGTRLKFVFERRDNKPNRLIGHGADRVHTKIRSTLRTRSPLRRVVAGPNSVGISTIFSTVPPRET